jgi:DNA-directed RNA polymerase subunit RPC12/RpoP
MEIRCPACSRKYIIPDDRLADRLAYFTCDACGEKVVVRPRGERGTGHRPLKDALLSAGDILDGLRLSFNLKNCIVSFFALISIGLLLFCSAVAASFVPTLLAEMPALGATLAVIIGLLCIFIFDLCLYLISKNNVHRMETGTDIRYGEAADAILYDLKTVSLVSVGLPAACIVFTVPFLLIGEGRVLYAGITYPALVVLFAALVLAQILKNILMAYIAARPGSVDDTLVGILKFIVRENINIPLYLVLIRVVSAVFFILVMLVPLTGILLVAGIVSVAGAGSYTAVNGLLSGGLSALGPGTVGNLPLDIQTGIVLLVIFSVILLVICGSYLISLWQTLSSVAVAIMESNPGRSISRTAVLIWVFLAAILAWSVLAVVLTVAGAAHLFT